MKDSLDSHIFITLPFPVSVNQLYGGGSKQQRYPSKKYKAWLASCPPLERHKISKANAVYRFFVPDNRDRDLENYVKCVSDYLVKQRVIADDSWKELPDLWISFGGVDKKNPRVEIKLEILEHYSTL